MKINELEDQFFEIENQYYSKEFYAHSRGFTNKERYWQKKRELNTHAYFLFLFTRLEEHIRRESKKLINKKKTNIQHWKTRAVWDNINVKNIHFRNRLALLTERGDTTFNIVMEYYKKRNEIGHGGTIENINSAIDMTDVFDKVKVYFKTLKG